jgi:hypothetical protein
MLRSGRIAVILATPLLATLLVNAGPRTDKIPDATVVGCLSQGDQPKVSISGSITKAGGGASGEMDRLKVSAIWRVSKSCQ